MDYYNEIKDNLISNEVYKRIKDYSKNRSDLDTYYKVGKLLYDAGKHYGEMIIKEYAVKLTGELGRGYTETNLKYFRQFYLFSKSHTVCDKLTWSHYRTLLIISNQDEVNYYVRKCYTNNLTVRELKNLIKSKEYQRLSKNVQNKLINNEQLSIAESIFNPIQIKNKSNKDVTNEKALHLLILEDIESFMRELGSGYTFVGSEYKIKLGTRYNYIDNNLKIIFQDKTIGIILCKKNNNFVMEYCSDERILTREYKLI